MPDAAWRVWRAARPLWTAPARIAGPCASAAAVTASLAAGALSPRRAGHVIPTRRDRDPGDRWGVRPSIRVGKCRTWRTGRTDGIA